MQLSTTFRHMDGSQAVREYTAERLEKIKKYFHKGPISAHAVFSVERGFHHVADLNITLPERHRHQRQGDDRGHVLLDRSRGGAHRAAGAQVEGEDSRPQAARRSGRDGARAGHPRRGDRAAAIDAGDHRRRRRPPSRGGYKIIKDERLTARSMTVEDAVMQMNLLGRRAPGLHRRRDGLHVRPLPPRGRQLRPHRDGSARADRGQSAALTSGVARSHESHRLSPAGLHRRPPGGDRPKPGVLAELSETAGQGGAGRRGRGAAARARGARDARVDGHRRRDRHPPRQARTRSGHLVGALGRAVGRDRVRVDRR